MQKLLAIALLACVMFGSGCALLEESRRNAQEQAYAGAISLPMVYDQIERSREYDRYQKNMMKY